MKSFGITEVDIASALKIHPITITRFLNNERVRRSTEAMLERYMTDVKRDRQDATRASG